MKISLVSQPMIMSADMLRRMDSRLEDINGVSDPDLIYEDAGRGCYRSWERPNPATRTNVDYLGKSIIANQHFSVLEHGMFTFQVEGVSRALLAELTRHRHLSFSVESLRYCAPRGFVIHPTLQTHWEQLGKDVESVWNHARYTYFKIFDHLLTDQGLPKKQAREAARMVLPLMTETDLMVSANARAWREVIDKRWDADADREIAELAGEFLRLLKAAAPSAFQDMPEPALVVQ
jgi:thymidylate synthase (FAD)